MTTEKAAPVTLEVQVTSVSEKAKKDGTGSYRLLDILLGGKPNKVFVWSPDAVLGVVAGKTYRMTVEKRPNASGAGFFYTLVGSPQEITAPPASTPGAVGATPAAEHPTTNGGRERSIERQVAAYVTATVVAAAIAKGLSPEEFNTWAGKALALAARMGTVIETGEYSVPKEAK